MKFVIYAAAHTAADGQCARKQKARYVKLNFDFTVHQPISARLFVLE